jgi:predicted acylesterase/phospholipase RssA
MDTEINSETNDIKVVSILEDDIDIDIDIDKDVITDSEIKKEKPIIKHLVCSGGGCAGFTFYGVLKNTCKNGLWKIDDIKTLYGTSVGSILSVMIALKYDWDTIDNYLIKRPWHNIYKIDIFSLLVVFNRKGFFDKKVIQETFLPLFNGKDISIDITMKEFFEITNIEIHIFTIEIHSFEIIDISYKTHPDWKVIDAVYASSSVPVIFSPFFKDNHCYCDGGFLINYPIEKCISNGAKPNEILAIKRIHKCNDDKITVTNTLFEYIIFLFFIILEKIVLKNIIKYEITNEFEVDALHISLNDIYKVSTNMDERIRLIDYGVELSNKIIEKNKIL